MSTVKPNAVVVCDPVSTGANFAADLLNKGQNVICVWSNNVSEKVRRMVAHGIRNDYTAVVRADPDDLSKTVQELRSLPYNIISILAGSEPAVELTDDIAEAMSLPGNGTALTHHRRDKYLMSERVRACGIKAVEQRRCYHWEECLEFAHQQVKHYEEDQHINRHYQSVTMTTTDDIAGTTTTTTTRTVTIHNDEPLPFYLIIKPARSSGSDDVFKCNTIGSMKEKFHYIINKKNKLDIINDCVLVQELLEGDEYVIDTVSCDGEHKLAGAWKYLKGSANGADFVYFGMVICDGHDPIVQQIYQYTKQVLNALDIKNSAGHAEIMYNPRTGPCLVEIGARLHGGEGIFIPVAQKLNGYTIIDVLSAAAMGKEEFSKFPELCTLKNKGYGAVIDLVCYDSGTLKHINSETDAKIRQLPTFVDYKCLPEPGATLEPTVDMFSTVGCVLLLSEEESTHECRDQDNEKEDCCDIDEKEREKEELKRKVREEERFLAHQSRVVRDVQAIRELEKHLWVLE